MFRRRSAIAVLMLTLLALAGAGSPAAAERELIKVFVVTDPAQTLPSIAGDTLGDPGRSAEILALNRGLAQPDGGALTSATEPLHPGWILRLPPDASGPDVKLARDDNQTGVPPAATGGTAITFPLAAALAVLGSILLALLTALIVARRRAAGLARLAGRAVAALGAPARRRRRLEQRRSLGRRFAADSPAVRRAYDTIGDVATTAERPEPVYALTVGDAGPTVWLPASDKLTAPWQHIDSTRWHRPAAAGRPVVPARSGMSAAQAEQAAACLVRAGSDAGGEPVFVDLSRLDGVLSVTGDRAVARDVVQNLLAEIARVRPNTPVTVLTSAGGTPPALPSGLNRLDRVPVPMAGHGPREGGTVRGAAARVPVGGLVVLDGDPADREAAELLALCGTAGAGWTGLVCGAVGGAHWSWHAAADGTVEIPVLGLELTVPAPAAPSLTPPA